jgi:4'-phosphopantetheinyl transferase
MTSSPSWLLASCAPALSALDVHLWRAALDLEPADLEGFEKTLTPEERARAARFHFPKDRKRFVARRGLLREILACYLGREPGKLQLRCRPGGKPFLLGDFGAHELHFNLAHSAGLALYAIARHREVGVDLERIQPHLADQQVAERFFSRQESLALRTQPAGLRVQAFFNCWTRKEAYLKARGEGLLAPLDSFDVSLSPDQPATLLSVDDGRWSLYALTPAPGFAAAVVLEGSNCNLRLWEWRTMMGSSCTGDHQKSLSATDVHSSDQWELGDLPEMPYLKMMKLRLYAEI